MSAPLTPRALRTRWSVQRLSRRATAVDSAASRPEHVRGTACLPERGVEALGLCFPSPLLVAAGFDRRGTLLAHAAALGLGGVETGSHRADATHLSPLLAVAAWRRGDAPRRQAAPARPCHGLSLAVPTHTFEVRRRSELLCRALTAWQAAADYVVLNPGRSGASPAECVELLAALAALRDRLPRARRLALVAKLPPAWMDNDAVVDWARRLVAAGADGLLVSAEAAPQRADARLATLAAAVGPRVCLISVGGIDSVRAAEARLTAGARLVQLHRALLGPPSAVASLLAALAAPGLRRSCAAAVGGWPRRS